MNTVSKHGLLDLWVRERFNESLEEIIKRLRERYGAIQEISHGDTSFGVSDKATYCVRAFPEEGHIQVDIHTRDKDEGLSAWTDELKKLIPLKKCVSAIFRRGDPAQRQITRFQASASTAPRYPRWAQSKDLPLS